jgi:hypothetical protein
MHPNLANNQVLNQAYGGVNTENAIGTPIDNGMVLEAEGTAELLKAARSEVISNSLSTTNVLFSASPGRGNRARC